MAKKRKKGFSKYHSKKTVVDGITFDSQEEAKHYLFLKEQERQGIISDLRLQVPFVLVPKQYEEVIVYTPKRKKEKHVKKLVERSLEYDADFVYIKDGKQIVEDVKGDKSGEAYRMFVVKRKLMLWVHHIKVVEI